MNAVFAEGFAPVWDRESRVLILGSFPSVKSRAVGFYYGNPQNRFWRTVCGFFGENVPADTAGKTEFLLRRRIALWDVVTSCEIVGSSDVSIRNETVADLPALLAQSSIRTVLCNGSKSYSLLALKFPQLIPLSQKLSSTSPANPRFDGKEWETALEGALKITEDKIC